ncbi:MAG TPA: bifunctional acetate--CoA ligase family protein/GNAT family N-acetyltransferase [Vineibacter sp.]|nr:bifunctional acetate--CoA ligase family protein/GNAT family N-acetyltransferase [Vineibacter sp.]
MTYVNDHTPAEWHSTAGPPHGEIASAEPTTEPMSIRNLDSLFAPKSVAIVGASNRPRSVGEIVTRNLLHGGFGGAILPVNPHDRSVAGIPAYPTVAELPLAPDLAVIATPPDTAAGLVDALGARGARAVVILTAGFGEGGAERGLARRQAVLNAARPYLLRVLGPNCLGIAIPGAGLNATFAHVAPLAGDIALLTQSGGMAVAMLDWAIARGIGFSSIVSMGDMIDVDFGDLLDYIATDSRTKSILLYAEGVTQARKFMSAARRAARAKPVLVVKAGRVQEGAAAAASHTGALAGADDVYDAAFRRAGMLRVVEMEELFDAAATLARIGPPAGDRLAIMSNGGGPGVLATDALIAAGGRLATLAPATLEKLDAVLPAVWSRSNPVDIIGDADAARYRAAASVLLDDQGSDAVLIANCPTAITSPVEAARGVVEAMQKAAALDGITRKPVLAAWLGEAAAAAGREQLAAAGVAQYDTPERAVRAFMHLVRHRESQALLLESPQRAMDSTVDPGIARRPIEAALEQGRAWLDPVEVTQVLASYGIPTVRTLSAHSPEEAASLVPEDRAIALKIQSRDIVHKSDVDGVALGLRGAASVRTEAAAMQARVRRALPAARIDGFTVQDMINRPRAIELIAGITVDPTFGPVIMFGHGGTAVEVLRDRSLELPPLNTTLARAQIQRTRVFGLLKGFRDRKPSDIEGLARVLVRLGQLAADWPEIIELDLNPLLADAEGVLVLDGRIRVQRPLIASDRRMAIRPYPKDLEATIALADGSTLAVRPVRPDDAAELQRLIIRTQPEDLRLRFFRPMRELSPQMAAQLCQIDYDREMALVADAADGFAGVVRMYADPDGLQAEFAVLVRSDLKGRGLGWALMQRIIAVARDRGIGEIFGDVMQDNAGMLALSEALGFRKSPHPDDRNLIRVRLNLAGAGQPS